MQNFNHLMQGHIYKFGVEWRRRKFNEKLAISRKRWEIRPILLLITNKKSHIGFQMTWKLLTLNEFRGHRQPVGLRSAILKTAGLLVELFISFYSLKQKNLTRRRDMLALLQYAVRSHSGVFHNAHALCKLSNRTVFGSDCPQSLQWTI